MDTIENLLGFHAEKLEGYQMCARAFVIFFVSLFFIRIAGIRTLGKQSAFDQLTALMLGAIMGRAIVTEQSFYGSLGAGTVIILLRRFVAWLSFLSKNAGGVLKGNAVLLWKNGRKYPRNLSVNQITENDILEALRKGLHTESFEGVKEIYLERSGEISIVK